nr:DUF4374 domain-containing protein [uncultured Dyadobacter sp.]
MNCSFRSIYPGLLLLLCVIFTLTGCQKHPEQQQPAAGRYSVYAMMKNGREYIFQTDTLTSGSVNPEKTGAHVVPAPLYYDLIVRDGRYYSVDRKTGAFVRYRFENNEFVKDTTVPLTGFSTAENYQWLSKDTLMLLGYDDQSQKIRFAKVNVSTMQADQGETPVPKPFGNYNWISVGFSEFLAGKLYIGYCYHSYTLQKYTTGDTIYTAIVDFPQMKLDTLLKDTRSVYPGGANTRQSHSFVTESGDFYFIACPGIASGNRPDKPTGIFRIKKSQRAIDPDYFFNISASPIRNNGYGCWYIGKGKAIVRTERKGLFTGMKDHYKVPHFDFYLLDLEKQTTKRLELPLDKGTARQCVLVEEGRVYITVNSSEAGNYVWMFNPETGELKKGLKFSSDTDYILRLEMSGSGM